MAETTTATMEGQVDIKVDGPMGNDPVWKFKDTVLARFLPAIATAMIWLYVITYDHTGVYQSVNIPTLETRLVNGTLENVTVAAYELSAPLGTLWDNFFDENYPMTCAMIAGSLIAGSTPLGGGVVAFPIAVLVLGLKPAQGRDFTVLIQSAGMNAAGYLLMVKKIHLLDFTLIATFVIFGIPGALIALAVDLKPFRVTVTFQILVLEFAIVFFYLNVLSPMVAKKKLDTAPPSPVMKAPLGRSRGASGSMGGNIVPASLDMSDTKQIGVYATMAAFAFGGGFLSGNVGSGSDILLFAYGHFVWNVFMPHKKLNDSQLTASSVVVMGLMSAFVALPRLMCRLVAQRVFEVWGACAWLVVFGAPLGSLFLTPFLQSYLRIVFYCLAIGQFIGFAIIKVDGHKEEGFAWTLFTVVTVVIMVLVVFHRQYGSKKIVDKGETLVPITPGTIIARLLPQQFELPATD